MAVDKVLAPIAATRVTYKTSTSFTTVESRLVDSIRPASGTSAWPNIVQSLDLNSSASPALQPQFQSAVADVLGPHGFMEFLTLPHSSWLPVFDPATARSKIDGHALQIKRFILGNPLIAITMLERDVDAGLFVPVEMLLVEDSEGPGCRIIYMLPSGLVAGYEGASVELKAAAEKLDEKLEALVRDITRDG